MKKYLIPEAASLKPKNQKNSKRRFTLYKTNFTNLRQNFTQRLTTIKLSFHVSSYA